MLTKSHFESLAAIAANILTAARNEYGEEGYALMYDNAYVPIVNMCERENPRFDMTGFSYRVATIMNAASALAEINSAGKEIRDAS